MSLTGIDHSVIIEPTNEIWGCGRMINFELPEVKQIVDNYMNFIIGLFGGNIPYYEDVAWMYIIDFMNGEGLDTNNIDFKTFDFESIAKKHPATGIWCLALNMINDPYLIHNLKILGGGRCYLINDGPKNGKNPNILLYDMTIILKSRLPSRYLY